MMEQESETGVFQATLTELRTAIDEEHLTLAALREAFYRMEVIAYLKDCRSVPGAYVAVSKRWETHHGIMRDIAEGKTDFDLMPPKIADKRNLDERAALDAGYSLQIVEQGGCAQTEYKPLKHYLTPLRIGGTAENFIVGVAVPHGWRS
jgi:hypothetical protein